MCKYLSQSTSVKHPINKHGIERKKRLNPGDVRITTKIYEHDLQMALFSSIHEAGHAIYEQNIAPELTGTLLADGASMGIHESQSRFWENIVGRSLENKYSDVYELV